MTRRTKRDSSLTLVQAQQRATQLGHGARRLAMPPGRRVAALHRCPPGWGHRLRLLAAQGGRCALAAAPVGRRLSALLVALAVRVIVNGDEICVAVCALLTRRIGSGSAAAHCIRAYSAKRTRSRAAISASSPSSGPPSVSLRARGASVRRSHSRDAPASAVPPPSTKSPNEAVYTTAGEGVAGIVCCSSGGGFTSGTARPAPDWLTPTACPCCGCSTSWRPSAQARSPRGGQSGGGDREGGK
jgi:hypothetical protein